MECKRCKSKRVWKCGIVIRSYYKLQRYQCKDCGFLFTDSDSKRISYLRDW